MQANNADAQNQAVVYSNFAITGTAQPFSENFLADSVLDTTNVWTTSMASGPQGVFIAPPALPPGSLGRCPIPALVWKHRRH